MLGVQGQNIYKGKEVRLKRAARLWFKKSAFADLGKRAHSRSEQTQLEITNGRTKQTRRTDNTS